MSVITQRLRGLRHRLGSRRESRMAFRAQRAVRRAEAHRHYKDLKRGKGHAGGGGDVGGAGM